MPCSTQTPANYHRTGGAGNNLNTAWRRRGPAYRPVLRPVHRLRDPLEKTEVSDLKRISLVLVLALALSLVFVGSAFANFGPHGGYISDTDSCAGCHRAHTSFSTLTFMPEVVPDGLDDADNPSSLLVGSASTMTEFCNACHGDTAPGASTNVVMGLFDGGPSSPHGPGPDDGVVTAVQDGLDAQRSAQRRWLRAGRGHRRLGDQRDDRVRRRYFHSRHGGRWRSVGCWQLRAGRL